MQVFFLTVGIYSKWHKMQYFLKIVSFEVFSSHIIKQSEGFVLIIAYKYEWKWLQDYS